MTHQLWAHIQWTKSVVEGNCRTGHDILQVKCRKAHGHLEVYATWHLIQLTMVAVEITPCPWPSSSADATQQGKKIGQRWSKMFKCEYIDTKWFQDVLRPETQQVKVLKVVKHHSFLQFRSAGLPGLPLVPLSTPGSYSSGFMLEKLKTEL